MAVRELKEKNERQEILIEKLLKVLPEELQGKKDKIWHHNVPLDINNASQNEISLIFFL